MASFGEELRRQRELRAVSLREISDATKINIRFLEALEENDFKHLPGGQFNKGFVRAYAKHIGVSGEEMVESYLLELRGQEESGGPRRPAAPRGSPPLPRPGRLLSAALLLLLLVIVSGVLWLFLRTRPGSEARSVRSSRPADDVGAPSKALTDGAHAVPSGGDRDQESGLESGRPHSLPAVPEDTGATAAPAIPRAATEPAPSQRAPEPSGGTHETSSSPPSPGGSVVPGTATPGEGREASLSPSAAVPSAGPPSTEVTPNDAAPPAPARKPGAEAGGDLVLRVIPFQPVRFSLLCGGNVLYSGHLAAGNPLRFQCAGVYVVTLDDAGAVSMSVNGERIYLGRPGQSIAGRHVSAGNYLDFVRPPPETTPR